MKTILRIAVFFACLSSLTGFSQTTSREQKIAATITKNLHKSNLIGWKGIYFFCEYDEAIKNQARVCEREKAQARYLAAALRIKLETIDGWGPLVNTKNRSDHLAIVLKIQTSAENSQPYFITTDLRAVAAMARDLINPQEQNFWPGHDLSGYLILWNTSVFGATNESVNNLTESLGNAIDENLKSILTDFAEINTGFIK